MGMGPIIALQESKTSSPRGFPYGMPNRPPHFDTHFPGSGFIHSVVDGLVSPMENSPI